MPTSSTSRSSSTSRGFTLIEVIVTIGIVAVIMGIVVTNQGKYTDATLLNNTVVDASLMVRQAQVSGVSVREFQTGSGNFSSAYGAMFQVNNGYFFFADTLPKDGYYNGPSSCPVGASSECLEMKALTSGVSISTICVISTDNSESCTAGRVDITFVRPETDAHFVFWDASISPMAVSNVKGARVKFHTPSGLERSLVVYTTGQISIQ